MESLFFDDSTVKLQRLTASASSSANQGTIPNGMRCITYRVAVHVDGFQKIKSIRQSQSFAGLYLLLVGLTHFERNSSQAFCLLCLTPYGCPMVLVRIRIIDNVVTAATEGIRGVQPDGQLR